MPTESLKRLLSAHRGIQARHHVAVESQIKDLYDEIEVEIESIAQQEQIWLAAELEVLRQIRVVLAQDARSLFETFEFTRFLERLSEQPIFRPIFSTGADTEEGIEVNPYSWVLNRIDCPFKIREFEREEERYTLKVVVGCWEQPFEGKVAFLQVSNDYSDNRAGWIEIDQKLQETGFDELNLSDSEQAKLRQEIGFVVYYLLYLFFPRPQIADFTYPKK